MARAGKLEEAEKLLKKANKLWQPSILDMRLKPDWEGAAPLFEKAALAFKVRVRGGVGRCVSVLVVVCIAPVHRLRHRTHRTCCCMPP
jgi:hypothetical protein